MVARRRGRGAQNRVIPATWRLGGKAAIVLHGWGSLSEIMGALDLLFATKPESERLHQAALMVLIERTPLLSVLTGLPLRSPEVTWEPEQGAFDLMVKDADGRRVLIELKIDSVLSRRQILAQLEHEAVTSGGTPIYLLLGTSGICRGPRWNQWKWILGERPRPAIFDAGALTAALQAAVESETDAEVRELSASYVRLVERLSTRTRGHVGKSVDTFEYHDYLGYFDELRQAVDFGWGATVEYVPNAAGGFVCCAWEGVPTRVGGLYLQFEEQDLCLKLWVDDMEKKERPEARRVALEAAIAAAAEFPNLGIEAARGRAGESMTLAWLTKVKLAADPRDAGLLATLRETQAFVAATEARLKAQ